MPFSNYNVSIFDKTMGFTEYTSTSIHFIISFSFSVKFGEGKFMPVVGFSLAAFSFENFRYPNG